MMSTFFGSFQTPPSLTYPRLGSVSSLLLTIVFATTFGWTSHYLEDFTILPNKVLGNISNQLQS